MSSDAGPSPTPPTWADGKAFEQYAARFLGDLWGVRLCERPVTLPGGVVKKFDLVSEDADVVGDAKFYRNISVPAAKWATIAEYVWLLQHVAASRRFIVFGQDKEVGSRWLARFRPLTAGIDFYFLGQAGLVTL